MSGKNRHIGSDFDDFLEENGLLAEAHAAATKRVIAHQLAKWMREAHLTKVVMARRMGTSRAAVDRLLDPDNTSVTLKTLERAAHAVGRELKLVLK